MRILVLEDSKPIRELVRARLARAGHQVEIVDNGHQGFIQATSQSYDLLISDVEMPHWDGFKFIEAMQVVCPRIPIVVVTAHGSDQGIGERLQEYPNVLAVLDKPLDFKKLFELLSTTCSQPYDSVNKMARIVCTLGPSSDSEEIIGRMILAGMDVARLNFSHSSYQQHEAVLAAVRSAESRWAKPVAVLQDLCGPKIRVGSIAGGSTTLRAGATVVLQAEAGVGTHERLPVQPALILADLRPGDPVLLDDGLLELRVSATTPLEVTCEVVIGGVLKSNKGINLPATSLSLPSITEKDWQDLEWGIENGVDYVALSFVRSASEIHQLREVLYERGATSIKIVAKIEKPEAVKHISEIISAADGIMIARGDMGVELPAVRVPRIQQEIIRRCWEQNTPVITATQMLDSMTVHKRPTRAEVTDVSMAVREGTDAVMLSQETATGIDPVNVIRTIASIIREEEQYTELSGEQYRQMIADSGANPVVTAAAGLSETAAVLLVDQEGTLYPLLSKWNRKIPTLLVTGSTQVARHAGLYCNVVPLIITETLAHDTLITKALSVAAEWGYVRPGQRVAVVEGERLTEAGVRQVGSLHIVLAPGGQ